MLSRRECERMAIPPNTQVWPLLATVKQLIDWLDDIYQRTDGGRIPCYMPGDARKWLEGN